VTESKEFAYQFLKYFELTDDRRLLASNGQVLFDKLDLDLPTESWTSLLSSGSIQKNTLQYPILGPEASMMLVLSALHAFPIAKSIPYT